MTRYTIIQTTNGYIVAAAHLIDGDIQTFTQLGNGVFPVHDAALADVKRMLAGRSNIQGNQ